MFAMIVVAFIGVTGLTVLGNVAPDSRYVNSQEE